MGNDRIAAPDPMDNPPELCPATVCEHSEQEPLQSSSWTAPRPRSLEEEEFAQKSQKTTGERNSATSGQGKADHDSPCVLKSLLVYCLPFPLPRV